MKKHKLNIKSMVLHVSCLALLTLSGCDFLDFDESSGKTKEEAYGYFANVKSLANAAYRSIPCDWGVIGNALRESASDNSIYTWNNCAIYDIYNDAWSPKNLIDDQWSTYYSVIRDINSFLENYSDDALIRHKWDANYEDNMKQVQMSRREVVVLRALYYFELAKRYGDVPLLTKPCTLNEVNSLKKTPVAEILKFVADECESVADELPLSHNDFYGETGRVTKGTALAIRARALLYAASPLFIGNGNQAEAWEKAAKAANDVIAMNYYSLPGIDNDPLYKKDGGNIILTSPQLIFGPRASESITFETQNLPIGFANGTNSGNTPTQNLVDAFEMKDGSSFDWNDPVKVANMYYDENGKETRDPRLYRTVICNGMTYMNTQVNTYEGSRFGSPIEGATMTGYYLRKGLNETVSLDPTNTIKKPHHYPTFRYAEVLLNYAEALNELKGPNDKGDLSLTANEALNQVRIAANMPTISINDKDEFRTKVRNERRIELAFEDHRFWDIRRWKTGDVVKEIYGVKIQKQGNGYKYTKQVIQTRTWDDKMYLYPIPQTEVYLNENLTQNPGW